MDYIELTSIGTISLCLIFESYCIVVTGTLSLSVYIFVFVASTSIAMSSY